MLDLLDEMGITEDTFVMYSPITGRTVIHGRTAA